MFGLYWLLVCGFVVLRLSFVVIGWLFIGLRCSWGVCLIALFGFIMFSFGLVRLLVWLFVLIGNVVIGCLLLVWFGLAVSWLLLLYCCLIVVLV